MREHLENEVVPSFDEEVNEFCHFFIKSKGKGKRILNEQSSFSKGVQVHRVFHRTVIIRCRSIRSAMTISFFARMVPSPT